MPFVVAGSQSVGGGEGASVGAAGERCATAAGGHPQDVSM